MATACSGCEPMTCQLSASGSRAIRTPAARRGRAPAWRHMLDAALAVGAEAVEPQAVPRRIDQLHHAGAERRPLRRLDLAFEDGVLHLLAEVEAGAGDTAQARAASPALGVHVIGHEHQHGLTPDEGRITVQVPAQVAGEHLSLRMRHEAEGHRLVEERRTCCSPPARAASAPSGTTTIAPMPASTGACCICADTMRRLGAIETRAEAIEQGAHARKRQAADQERQASAGRPVSTFDNTLRTTLTFLANPWKLWESERLETAARC